MSARVSARVAAARCGVSERTVRRWIHAGHLAADKDGGGYLVDPDELAALAAARRGQAADSGQPPRHGAATSDNVSEVADIRAADSAATVELVRLVEKLTQQNLELSGRVGYYLAQLEQAKEQLALQAPQPEPAATESTPAVEATPAPATRPWWRRFW